MVNEHDLVGLLFAKYFNDGDIIYSHYLVLWASDWRRIEQTLHSRRSPPETEDFSLFLYSHYHVEH